MVVISWLLRHRHHALVQQLLFLFNIEIPATVTLGDNLVLQHRGRGVVVTFNASIGNDVTIYHNVTIGRSRAHLPSTETVEDKSVRIGDNAVLYTGCVVLGASDDPVTVGEGTIVGANSVLNRSTGAWEIWAGVPAKKIKDRGDRPRAATGTTGLPAASSPKKHKWASRI